jgi:thioredoxin-like negative regulator of GroEL
MWVCNHATMPMTMSDTTVPEFFQRFPMQKVTEASLDDALREIGAPVGVLFLWRRDCPNCDIAKRAMLLAQDRFQWPQVRWMHDNVYDDPTMATRFGLHGIPTFIIFRDGRKIGRISAWPGAQAFVAALENQIPMVAPA